MIRGIWLLGAILVMVCVGNGCSSHESSPAVTHTPQAPEPPATKGQPIQHDLRADTLTMEAFRDKADHVGYLRKVDVADYPEARLATMAHFNRLFLKPATGPAVEFPAMDFYCLSFATRTDGKMDIVTLKLVPGGSMAYLYTLGKDLNMLTVTEIARAHEQDGFRSRKWGGFPDDKNYLFTYTYHEGAKRIDSLEGTILLLANGNHKRLGQDQGN